jgi:hypothetical protein
VADRSNYADRDGGEYTPATHKVFHHDYRAFSPHGGANGEHLRGQLSETAKSGDHFWNPGRNRVFPQFEMPAFKGVPPSGAESMPRVTAVEADAEDIWVFQSQCRAQHQAAGDYQRSATGTIL